MANFSLIAKLGIDKTGFDAGLRAAATSANQFGKQMGANMAGRLAAAFSVAAITAYTKSLIRYASEVKDASQATGVSVESVQSLGFAAKQTGSDLATVTRALGALSKSRQEALDKPSSDAAQVFKALGIDGQKLKDLKLEDLFRAIAQAFNETDFGASKLAMMRTILGKTADDLASAFEEGLDILEAQAIATGQVMDASLIDPLDEMGDQLDVLIGQLRGPFAEALVAALKVVNELVDKLALGAKTVVGYTKGFADGFKKPQESPLPGWLGFIAPGLDAALGITKRIKEGHKEANALLDFEAAKEDQQGMPEDGLLFGFAKDQQERKKREFHFENLLREREPRASRHSTASDALGRIGGTVGAGDAVQTKLTELVREQKELRRLLEFRGIAIKGEL